MKILWISVFITLTSIFGYHIESYSTNWIKCPSDCSRVMCTHYKTLKRFCQYGTVFDHCGCCQVCAVGPDQVCGGPGDVYGKCGPGMYCFPADRHPSQTGRCIRKSFLLFSNLSSPSRKERSCLRCIWCNL